MAPTMAPLDVGGSQLPACPLDTSPLLIAPFLWGPSDGKGWCCHVDCFRVETYDTTFETLVCTSRSCVRKRLNGSRTPGGPSTLDCVRSYPINFFFAHSCGHFLPFKPRNPEK